ncbi:MAG TPA: RNA polymerase sigma factor [Thermoleophilaceae bacterium]|jgi:RNA polymerase sigma-70 factor (ECF subfamily)
MISDESLLERTAGDVAAFGTFYERNLGCVLRFFMVRVGDAELAADLTAEVFAAALVSAPRYDRRKSSPRTWLYAIARNKLADSIRRRRVEDRARRMLGMEPVALEDEDIARIEGQAGGPLREGEVLDLLGDLPDSMREAVTAHVIAERGYGEIAAEMRCSCMVIRKRVSRGLERLRERLAEEAR